MSAVSRPNSTLVSFSGVGVTPSSAAISLIRRAIAMSRLVTPPASWLTSRAWTTGQVSVTSGWWSASSAAAPMRLTSSRPVANPPVSYLASIAPTSHSQSASSSSATCLRVSGLGVTSHAADSATTVGHRGRRVGQR